LSCLDPNQRRTEPLFSFLPLSLGIADRPVSRALSILILAKASVTGRVTAAERRAGIDQNQCRPLKEDYFFDSPRSGCEANRTFWGAIIMIYKVRNSWWWGDGMPRPLCWIWHKAHWMLAGRLGYSQCWRCGRCNRTWVEDLWS
jgi:hypothetical protein